MHETFVPPLVFSLGDILYVGVSCILIGAWIGAAVAILFFVNAHE